MTADLSRARTPDTHGSWPGLFVGLALTAALHFIIQWSALLWFPWPPEEQQSAAILPDFRPLMPILLIGVSQLFYMVPAFVIAKLAKWHGVARGLVAGAGITVVLNTIGFALLSYMP